MVYIHWFPWVFLVMFYANDVVYITGLPLERARGAFCSVRGSAELCRDGCGFGGEVNYISFLEKTRNASAAERWTGGKMALPPRNYL